MAALAPQLRVALDLFGSGCISTLILLQAFEPFSFRFRQFAILVVVVVIILVVVIRLISVAIGLAEGRG